MEWIKFEDITSLDSLEAGKYTDLLVATELMGYEWCGSPTHNKYLCGPLEATLYKDNHRQLEPPENWYHCKYFPNFSTDYTLAFSVIARLRNFGFYVKLNQYDPSNSNNWRCEFKFTEAAEIDGEYFTAATAPLAICKAALMIASWDPPIAIEGLKRSGI